MPADHYRVHLLNTYLLSSLTMLFLIHSSFFPLSTQSPFPTIPNTYVGEAVGRRGVPCIASSSPPPRPSRDQMTLAPPQWRIATGFSLYTHLCAGAGAPSGALRWYTGPLPPAALLSPFPHTLPLPFSLLPLRQWLRLPLLPTPPPLKLLVRHLPNPPRHLLAAGRRV